MWNLGRGHSETVASASDSSLTSIARRGDPAKTPDDLRAQSIAEAKIGKGQCFKGTISGSGPLFIDGRVEGDIDIPNERVTIGVNGVFVASAGRDAQCGIAAREIVVMGQVFGSLSASHRVEIFKSGSITGDLETPRLSIADGAFFKGGVNLCAAAPAAASETEPSPLRPSINRQPAEAARNAWVGVAS